MNEHRFGGVWTEAKLQALDWYLSRYVLVLKNQPFELHYIDGFAGTGSYVRRDGGGERAGSAKIALRNAGFHFYHLVEKQRSRCRVLSALCDEHRDKQVRIVEGDANEYIQRLCRETNWKRARALLFLDPYGMQVEWKTLEAISNTQAMDVWFLFPLFGVTRQLTNRDISLDDDKIRALDRTFGTTEWRQRFYGQVRQESIFPDEQGFSVRSASNLEIVEWITARLRSLFPLVMEPQVLRRGHNGKMSRGPALFSLYFLCANPNLRAQGAAKRIADGVIARLRRELLSER